AIESLRRKGLSVNLLVFDTERDSERVREIVESDSLRGMDLIIGPVFTYNLKIVAEFASERRIPVVSPLASRNDLLTDNPYLFQVQPTFETEIEKLGNFIARYYDKNIVLIHPGDSLRTEDIVFLKRRLFYHLSYRTFFDEVVFKEVVYNEEITKNDTINSLEHALTPDVQNIVLVASDEEAFVSNVVSNLNTLAQDYEITIIGYQSWQRFRNIELQHFYNLNLHICVPYILDYNSELVKDFIRNFRQIYHTEPEQFSFAWQGHDIAYYFLSGIARYGRRFRNYYTRHSVNLLESEYLFRKIDRNSGYENKQIHLIRYNKDFEITPVNSDYESEGINIYDRR
ncbi:MAG: amino acid ABC transporter substrate-binding protein, partial [Bacteroidales bacterium]